MTIYQRMQAVFTAAGIPGFLQGWRATPAYPQIPDKFAAYIVNSEGPALCADDAPLISRTELSLHVYGKTDVTVETAALRDALLARGFAVSGVRDLDDVREGDYIYHRRMAVTLIEIGG